MRLVGVVVEDGKITGVDDTTIELDAPVERYLTRWRFPEGTHNAAGVTVRRLLAHTAGLGDGLGYDGFANAARMQSVEDSLRRAADAMPGASGGVEIVAAPGSTWRYSGGGYFVLQLMVEEVTGQSFAAAMAERVFEPFGMRGSSFRRDELDAARFAANLDLDGEPTPFLVGCVVIVGLRRRVRGMRRRASNAMAGARAADLARSSRPTGRSSPDRSAALDQRKHREGKLSEEPEPDRGLAIEREMLGGAPPEQADRERDFRREQQRQRRGAHDEPVARAPRDGETARRPATGEPGDEQHERQLHQHRGGLAQSGLDEQRADRAERESGDEDRHEVDGAGLQGALHADIAGGRSAALRGSAADDRWRSRTHSAIGSMPARFMASKPSS